jgi:phytoene/squalene synthetase
LALAEATGTAAAERASGSSFYNAMRILPRPQRAAMFEIYSFCRQVDDIADSSGPRGERRDELDRWRADIDALYADRAIPRTQGLVAPVKDFALKREDFHAIIDGMEMDVVADIRAPDDATLERYCDQVASAVGRLSVRVFGMEDRDGVALAHHLGRALQLTNILRDLDEDAAFGRLYLPERSIAGTPVSPRPIPGRCWQARRSARSARDCRARARARAAGEIGAQPAPDRARAADHGRGLSVDPRQPRRSRLVASPPLDPPAARGLLWIIMRHAFIDAAHGGNRSRRQPGWPALPLRCCLRRAGRTSPCTRPPARPEGVAAPTTIPRSTW